MVLFPNKVLTSQCEFEFTIAFAGTAYTYSNAAHVIGCNRAQGPAKRTNKGHGSPTDSRGGETVRA